MYKKEVKKRLYNNIFSSLHIFDCFFSCSDGIINKSLITIFTSRKIMMCSHSSVAICLYIDTSVPMTHGDGSGEHFIQSVENFLHPDIVFFLLKDILFVDTPEHNMINACGTLLATLTWHLRSNLFTIMMQI